MPESDSEVKGGSPAGDKNKKAKKSSPKKVKAKRQEHPPTSEMVTDAIKTLKDRNGSSLTAIKNFMEANYEVDCVKLAPFIKKYIKSAVSEGNIIQTSGKGASGSFKLPDVTKVERKFTGAKPKDTAKTKKTPTKKAENKPEEEEKIVDEEIDSPKQKSTKPSKVPVKLTKVPTPKKATAKNKKTAKKSGRK